jgi:ketosteroid isomerase-like protein
MVKSSSNYILDWVPQLAEVSQAGDMGWTWGWYTTTYNDANGEQQTARGKYLNVWKKMPDGSWKVVADIGN